MQLTNSEIQCLDLTEMEIIVVRRDQERCVRVNPTSSHFTQFVRIAGQDVTVITTEQNLPKVLEAVQSAYCVGDDLCGHPEIDR